MRKITRDDTGYTAVLQSHLLACLLNNPSAFQTCRPILHPEFFDDQLVRAVKYALHYHDRTGKPAPISLVEAHTGVELSHKPQDAYCETAWLVNQIEEFCKFRAMENAILDGIDLLRAGKSEEIAQRTNDALNLSIHHHARYQELTLTDLAAETTPEWLIPGLLFERQVAMIYGPSASFKSFIVLHLSSLLAHGMMWNGQKLKPRQVKYIAAEGAQMMQKRRLAWLRHYQLPVVDDDLLVLPDPIMLLDPADVRNFIDRQQQKNWAGGLLVIDTLSKCLIGARESDVEVVTQAIASAERIGRELHSAVLLVHHSGWDAKHARGSSALLCNSDAMIRVDRKSDLHATISVEKQKDASSESFSFAMTEVSLGVRDQFGREVTSLCASEVTPDQAVRHNDLMALADRTSIAGFLSRNDVKEMADLVKLLVPIMHLSTKQVRRRVMAAIPTEWSASRKGYEVIEVRRVEVNRRMRIECR